MTLQFFFSGNMRVCSYHHTHPGLESAAQTLTCFFHLVFLLKVTLSSLSLPGKSRVSSRHRYLHLPGDDPEPRARASRGARGANRTREDLCGVINGGSFAINPKESLANPCQGREREHAGQHTIKVIAFHCLCGTGVLLLTLSH